jgi:hypothetical protein
MLHKSREGLPAGLFWLDFDRVLVLVPTRLRAGTPYVMRTVFWPT